MSYHTFHGTEFSLKEIVKIYQVTLLWIIIKNEYNPNSKCHLTYITLEIKVVG
jgi:hypothetical protein